MSSENRVGPREACENFPLLGHGYDVKEGRREILLNLWRGTAPIAQGATCLLAAIVLAPIFNIDVMLFHFHPLANMIGLFFAVQAILVLQPTRTAKAKTLGTGLHTIFNSTASIALLTGFAVIEWNKISHSGPHFASAHAVMGFAAYGFLVLQALVGVTQYYTPSLYGGSARAKAVWKYHRSAGYVFVLFLLATIVAALWTGFNINALHINLVAVVFCSVFIIVGILPGVSLFKLGIKTSGQGGGSGYLVFPFDR